MLMPVIVLVSDASDEILIDCNCCDNSWNVNF